MMTAYEIFQAHVNPKSKKGSDMKKLSDQELFDDHQAKKKKKGSKMRNKPVIIDNIWFQSEGEGYYYLELKSQWQRGKIKQIKRQIPFEFVVGGIKVGKYVADFGVIHHDGSLEIIDYKSRFTVTLALYQMKRALMLACYQVAIKEVGCR